MNKRSILALLMIIILLSFLGCTPENNVSTDSENSQTIILSTTTSTDNSGLLDYILPDFEQKTGVEVKVVPVGTGKALEMGRNGEADVLLVHAKASEEEFVAEGHGEQRYDVMYNDFIIIGPKEDIVKVKENASTDVVEALRLISENKATFVSRGDDSGTHKKEKSLWEEAKLTPEGDWYMSAGKGMGDVILMADETKGYTMTDRATYLSMKENIDLEILVEGDVILFNQYGVIPVNPNKNQHINGKGAQEFVEWLLSEETQQLIANFKKYNEVLFTPNAK